MKTNFISSIIVLMVTVNFYGQLDWASVDIDLEPNSFNKAHPYYEYFKTKDTDYIKWLYYGCASKQEQSMYSKQMSTNSNTESGFLIFKITNEGNSRYDTIRNCVHPGTYEVERDPGWESIIPIHGKLPDGVWSTLDNNPKGNTEVTLHVKETPINAKLEIVTEEGESVRTLVDDYFEKGTYDFSWNPKSVDPGSYLLHTAVDGQFMIQRIHVQDSWLRKALPFLFSDQIAYKKYRKSESSGKLPKGTVLSINHDRHGVTVGLTNIKNAQVRISLLKPDGSLIKNIINSKFKDNTYKGLLNRFVEKTGNYLLVVEVNGSKRTQKIKLKKQA